MQVSINSNRVSVFLAAKFDLVENRHPEISSLLIMGALHAVQRLVLRMDPVPIDQLLGNPPLIKLVRHHAL